MKKVTNVLKRNLTMSKKLALYTLFSSSSMMVQAMEYKAPEESDHASVSPTEAVVASDSASAQSNPMDEKLSTLESNYQQGYAQNPEFQKIATKQINKNLAENISIDLQITNATEIMNRLKERMQRNPNSPKPYQYDYDKTQSLLDQLYKMKQNTISTTLDLKASFENLTEAEKSQEHLGNKTINAYWAFRVVKKSNPYASLPELKALTKEFLNNYEASDGLFKGTEIQTVRDSAPYVDRLVFKEDEQA